MFVKVERQYPGIAQPRLIHEAIRRMINELVTGLVDESAARIRQLAPADAEAVRAARAPLVGFSAALAEEHQALKQFLMEHLYRHFRVLRMTRKATRVVRDLFDAYSGDVRLLPEEHRAAAERGSAQGGDAGRARAVADYIAGMTDRFAIIEHARLYDPGAPGA